MPQAGTRDQQEANSEKQRLGFSLWPPGHITLQGLHSYHIDQEYPVWNGRGNLIASTAWRSSQMEWSGFEAPLNVRGHVKCLYACSVVGSASLMGFWPGWKSPGILELLCLLYLYLRVPLESICSPYRNKYVSGRFGHLDQSG